jgi:cyclic beta-1,2-glucan synthetase
MAKNPHAREELKADDNTEEEQAADKQQDIQGPEVPEHWDKLALNLAEEHTASRRKGDREPLTGFLPRYQSIFLDAYRYFRTATEQELALSYAAEWILDNYHILKRVLRQIEENLPADYYRQLPKLDAGVSQGYPRVYDIARTIVIREDAHLDTARVKRFVHAYEAKTPLTMGELWALPIMLRLCILQAMVPSLHRIVKSEFRQDETNLPVLDLKNQTGDDEVIANAFISLRALAAEDWKDFFEELSLVELILSRDPAGVYALMDFETRDRYRKVVEKLAFTGQQDELDVAREVIRLAQIEADRAASRHNPVEVGGSKFSNQINDFLENDRRIHVGYYLLGRGRRQLEANLACPLNALIRLQRWIFSHPTLVYLGGILLITAMILLGLVLYGVETGAVRWRLALSALLGIIPAMTVAVTLVNWLVTHSITPRVLPKMDFSKGIPEQCKSLVVMPALLSNVDEIRALLQQLELHLLRNNDPNIFFALLTDLTDAPNQHMPEDDELVRTVREGIAHLNEKYRDQRKDPFFLFHRGRQWNPTEGSWMGWERKRGKLHQLNNLILGKGESSFDVEDGKLEIIHDIQFVITLDADTLLPRGSARRLIATLSHPLNQAEFASNDGPQRGEVVAGYTVLQPRTEINPAAANQSLFTRIFSGDTGLDLYTLAVSDVYQDLFGEGIYVGKGIYDVSAFERSLQGRVPENALLSHDLFEGIHGRTGLVTDVVLIEDYPPHYLVHSSRLHRWMRGDWQIIRWLGPQVPVEGGKKAPNRLSVIDRWKIIDNLRRSLVDPAVLTTFILGWTIFPGSALFWTGVGLVTLGAPILSELLSAFVQILKRKPLRVAFSPVGEASIRSLLALAFLPYEAMLDLDAIVTTLYRLYISRRHLLSWTTSAQSVRMLGGEINPEITWQKMIASLFWGVVLVGVLLFFDPSVVIVATPELVLWLLAPEIAYLISRPIKVKRSPLSEEQEREFRQLALRTFLYFEQFVGPEDHWLPPDHFQESPLGTLAHRTSPTNIGLYLLSVLGAYDMGYLGPLEMAAHLRTTFGTLEQLERYRGHFLNWYATHNRSPLEPRYVSTVDSGNLAACLIALKQGCLQATTNPVLRLEWLHGFRETLDLVLDHVIDIEKQYQGKAVLDLKQELKHLRDEALNIEGQPEAWIPFLMYLSEQGWELLDRRLVTLVESDSIAWDTEVLRRLRIFGDQLRNFINNGIREIEMLMPWKIHMQSIPEFFLHPEQNAQIAQLWQELQEGIQGISNGLANLSETDILFAVPLEKLRKTLDQESGSDPQVVEARDWLFELSEKLETGAMAAKVLQIGFDEIARQAESYFQAMDFTFLYDPGRKVFHIGYNLTLGELDGNYYDLLASESRIASIVAIGKGDVPQSHWLHLSRPFTRVNGMRALLSWSATMFEYLMPALLMRSYHGTLLDQTMEAVVKCQIDYARDRDVPWGISESGYYRFDSNMYYQYRAFGIPDLGFKRGLSDDLVISPYSSLLALSLTPGAINENIAKFHDLGMWGTYGLYEAVDFTPDRLSIGDKYEVVRSFMAHHQAMIFLSLVNYFHDQVMVQRFHADPRIQSVELLLQEQIPYDAPLETPQVQETHAARVSKTEVDVEPWKVSLHTPQPRLHYLSNGRYSVMVTNSGGGYSAWKDIDLTRWRADTTLNNWGTWIYIQERKNGSYQDGDLWSATYQPTGEPSSSQDVYFSPHKVEIRRRRRDISSILEIVVAPDNDVEIRRITITNHSNRNKDLRLISYGEIVLAPQDTDRGHPAFNKLFIESEYLADERAMLFRRRPRTHEEKPIFMAHMLVREPGQDSTQPSCEGDRANFLGRGGSIRNPRALRQGKNLSGTVGATLDPIMALACDVQLKPHTTAQLVYVTLAAESRQEALTLLGHYRAFHVINHAFEQARSQAGKEMRQLGLNTSEIANYQLLLSLLIYPNEAKRADPETLARNTLGQPALWPFSISGDYPILLVNIADKDDLSLVYELLQAHAYWRKRNLMIDLVIVNMQGVSYGQELQGHLRRLVSSSNGDSWLNRRGGLFLILADQVSEESQVLLETAARVVLDASHGQLAKQLQGLERLPTRLPILSVSLARQPGVEALPVIQRPQDLLLDNGLGGFSPDGREYVIYLQPGAWTPAPWINVIANQDFGFLVSDAGSGYSWFQNSGENRLTPWSNDPVSDPPGEALYLRDEETAQVWSPTPLPARADKPYLVRHGAGYSIFEHSSHGLKQTLRVFAAPDAPLKIIHLKVENLMKRSRRITATYYAALVLGTHRDKSQPYIIPEFDSEVQAILARNPYNTEFGECTAFLAANKTIHGLTTDRTEFIGRMGSLAHPAALDRIGLFGDVSPGVDPCAALQVHLDLSPQGDEEIFFLFGQAKDRAEAVHFVKEYKQDGSINKAWQGVDSLWRGILDKVQVHTPDKAMDLMLNQWLLYQALSCRIWGRSAFYQSSGAYGFRDQLQDVMALVFAAPEITRQHILRAARHQFQAGDVLHWWHPPSGRGVRTRISDDMLWLPYVTAHYVKTTGDLSILDEKIPFKTGPLLKPEEEERYDNYQNTQETFTLFEHCRRALDQGATSGQHKLPLMGTGDWNDGLNRVGIEGRGESIWLGWFLHDTLQQFAEVCDMIDKEEQGDIFRKRAAELSEALNKNGWDGDWYLRAYYDDGSPLGSSSNQECQIDSIAQSWAVLSRAGDEEKMQKAMRSLSEKLVREDDRLLLLFTPPFDKTPRDPGYIRGYLPGIRENGGQYTHAAIWAVWAFAELGQSDYAQSLFQMLNPIHHSDDIQQVRSYLVEPYVIAADIYSVSPHTGRGGWTWYTGSGGWMYRLGLEAILGLRGRSGGFYIDPSIPHSWNEFRLDLNLNGSCYSIQVENPDGVNRGVVKVSLDGEELDDFLIHADGDGKQHHVHVLMGRTHEQAEPDSN